MAEYLGDRHAANLLARGIESIPVGLLAPSRPPKRQSWAYVDQPAGLPTAPRAGFHSAPHPEPQLPSGCRLDTDQLTKGSREVESPPFRLKIWGFNDFPVPSKPGQERLG